MSTSRIRLLRIYRIYSSVLNGEGNDQAFHFTMVRFSHRNVRKCTRSRFEFEMQRSEVQILSPRHFGSLYIRKRESNYSRIKKPTCYGGLFDCLRSGSDAPSLLTLQGLFLVVVQARRCSWYCGYRPSPSWRFVFARPGGCSG